MKKPFIEVRDSPVHGKGVFAIRRIKEGKRVIEYTGERIPTKVGESRYQDDATEQAFVLLFTVDKKTLIDGGVDGSDAIYINHSCDPNCAAVLEDGRVFIESIRTIEEGEELNYDYAFEREKGDLKEWDALYACRCGAENCRGTMLADPKPKKKKKKKKKKSDANRRKRKKADGKRDKADCKSKKKRKDKSRGKGKSKK